MLKVTASFYLHLLLESTKMIDVKGERGKLLNGFVLKYLYEFYLYLLGLLFFPIVFYYS